MQPVDPERHPILNTPYESPARHWGLDERFRATNDLRDGRRPSGAYMSVPKPKSGAVRSVSAEGVAPHPRINLIRDEVGRWRSAGYPGVARATRELLEHWAGPNHEPRPFFCQREAVETLIWLLEAAPETPDFRRIRDELTDINRKRNEGIERLAVKMATGTGKTRVMAMIILWLTLRQRGRADFLVIVPNLTVKDRLSELDPARGAALYKSLTPPHRTPPVNRMRVTVLNFQAFQRRSALAVDGPDDLPSGTAKRWMKGHREAEPEHWTESPETMLDQLLRPHRGRRKSLFLTCIRSNPKASSRLPTRFFGMIGGPEPRLGGRIRHLFLNKKRIFAVADCYDAVRQRTQTYQSRGQRSGFRGAVGAANGAASAPTQPPAGSLGPGRTVPSKRRSKKTRAEPCARRCGRQP